MWAALLHTYWGGAIPEPPLLMLPKLTGPSSYLFSSGMLKAFGFYFSYTVKVSERDHA